MWGVKRNSGREELVNQSAVFVAARSLALTGSHTGEAR